MEVETIKSLKKSRRWIPILFWAIVAVGLAIGACLWIYSSKHYKRTNDAYVEGNPLAISPLVEGFITSIQSDDTYLVNSNQLLVTLDPLNYEIALNEAKENYASTVRRVCQIYHQTFAYQSEINSRFAELLKAEEFYNHRLEILHTGAISLEDLQASEERFGTSLSQYELAKSLYLKESSLIQGKSIRNNPLILAAFDKLVQAWVNLNRTHVYAPQGGIVAQRSAQLGKWVSTDQTLMTVIPLDQIWVNANFKETQMKKVKIGQSVRLYADMYGKNVMYRGTVAGIPAGAGNAFSILPPQNLSGNWIKIVQRLPVRVEIDPEDLKAHPLRLGMTMHAIVDIKSSNKGYLPKSNHLSPTYSTSIYKNETEGVWPVTNTIFDLNLDASLSSYVDTPFEPIPLNP